MSAVLKIQFGHETRHLSAGRLSRFLDATVKLHTHLDILQYCTTNISRVSNRRPPRVADAFLQFFDSSLCIYDHSIHRLRIVSQHTDASYHTTRLTDFNAKNTAFECMSVYFREMSRDITSDLHNKRLCSRTLGNELAIMAALGMDEDELDAFISCRLLLPIYKFQGTAPENDVFAVDVEYFPELHPKLNDKGS